MKVIVILSGGLDSTVLLKKMLHDGNEVKALSINYGQRHKRELDHAKTICEVLTVPHHIADLSSLRPLLAGSSQTDTIAVPHGHYAAENMKLTVVPNRNMLMLAVAGAWAISSKFDAIAYAAHAGDHTIYPDCREEFIKPLAQALNNADWHKVTIVRPFINLSKADIAALGNRICAPMHLTYSCYEGGPIHCGKCGTCVERREAFANAALTDSTVYMTDYDAPQGNPND